MQYRTIANVPAAEAEALFTRMSGLEGEHLGNKAALLAAEALPPGESRDQQIEQFRANLAVIEAVHAAVSEEFDKVVTPEQLATIEANVGIQVEDAKG